jgi:hypothetical protein
MKFFVKVKDSQVKQKFNPYFLNDFVISNIKSLQISEKIYLWNIRVSRDVFLF